MPAGTLPDLLHASSQRFPNRRAVVDSTGAALTYSELHVQSDALARFLRDRGVRPGDRVAVAIPKSLEAIVSFFGIMKAGAAYVPLDAWGPVERGRRILEDSDVSAVIVNRRTISMVPKGNEVPLIAVDRMPEVGGAVSFQDAIDAGQSCETAPHETGGVAYIIFTSGSTGMPKGAMITHANALSFLDWCSSELRPGEHDRFGNHSPLHFDPSVFDLYLAIKHGATVYLVSDELAKRPRELAAFIAARRLTLWCSTPSVLMMLARFGELDVQKCETLRAVLFGGEVFPPRQLRLLQQHWPSPVYYNLYGPTETTTACTFARIPGNIPDDRTAPYPIGFPCSHCRAIVLDEHGAAVAPGEEGLLHIGGPSVFAGYWNRPSDTTAAMIEHDGLQWYNTGDLVRWNAVEGFTYVGRKDGMVKRRGFRIELGEIERALYGHSQIEEAAVISVSDVDAVVRIVAFVACKGAAPSTIDLKTFCATAVPAYMNPDTFIVVEALPRTSTGKVDVHALKNEVMHAGVR